MDKRPLPESIEGERVRMAKHSLDEAERMFGYVDKDRERLRRFLPWVDATRSVADERAYITTTLEKWAAFKLFDA